jgi:hypothetical protein
VQCVVFLAALCELNLESFGVGVQAIWGEYSTPWENYFHTSIELQTLYCFTQPNWCYVDIMLLDDLKKKIS